MYPAAGIYRPTSGSTAPAARMMCCRTALIRWWAAVPTSSPFCRGSMRTWRPTIRTSQIYEWINGTGGTNDVLSNSTNPLVGGRPNQFAILPGLNANVAPYDPNISAGSTLQVGASVYLSGMPGLPAGVYQLLPARYALLPGAYLVTQVSGYQDIQNGQAFHVLGGGTIIAGYRSEEH